MTRPIVKDYDITVNLVDCSGSADAMISACRLNVDGLAVNHAGVVHEHNGLPAPVDSDDVKRVASDEAADLFERWPLFENGLSSVGADEAVLFGHADNESIPGKGSSNPDEQQARPGALGLCRLLFGLGRLFLCGSERHALR
jgi:hypothetical protein